MMAKTKKGNDALKYAIRHIEDFGDAKHTQTGELNCVGRLAYGCVNMAVLINVIKIMEGEKVGDINF